jgi:hypothetical protein
MQVCDAVAMFLVEVEFLMGYSAGIKGNNLSRVVTGEAE